MPSDLTKPDKQHPTWMLVLGAALLIGRVYRFFEELGQGWIRAFGFYPLIGGEALGYDIETLAEYLFIIWVGCRLLRGTSHAS